MLCTFDSQIIGFLSIWRVGALVILNHALVFSRAGFGRVYVI